MTSTLDPREGPRLLVVGAGWRFTSGISYYTCSLANALVESHPTDALLMRQLVPTFLYPGRRRVGTAVHDLAYDDRVGVLDGVDWWWGASMRRATRFVRDRQPEVVVLQWWTGAVLHSYLHLARQARRRGARVVMEWHEVQDTGEARVPGARRYVGAAMRLLLRQVDAHVVHSAHDLELLERAYRLSSTGAPVRVVPHGPYDHVRGPGDTPAVPEPQTAPQPGTDRPFHLLFFGVIRPYKGLEDLVAAFSAIPEAQRRGLHLTIVGETWEGWSAPLEAVAASPARADITVVNRYVDDREVQQHFAAADAVVLPYRRSSSSGPLHLAMSAGLPVVVTRVGGLAEAAAGYDGVRFVEPGDVAALTDALLALPALRGRRYADPRSWQDTVATYGGLLDALGVAPGPAHHPQPAAPRPLSEVTPS